MPDETNPRDLDRHVAALLYSNVLGETPCISGYCPGDNVVPFYHVSNNLAIAVLEQICDERQLVPRLLRVGKKWIVTLNAVGPVSDKEIVRVEDKSLALAICLALGELEEE